MEKYDDRMELAPRDDRGARHRPRDQSRARGGKEAACVWLDVTHLDADDTRAFPGVAAELRARGSWTSPRSASR